MDSTELHYLTYDPDEIWDEMTKTYIEEGGDILYPGDEKEMLLRAVLADIVLVFAGVDNALRMQTLRYAVGTYLDVVGENRDCERIEASAATATVKITTKATGSPSVMAAGTKMTADGEIFYLLQEDVTLSGYQESIIASVIADRTGSVGNGLLTGMEMGLSIPNDAIDNIIVTTDAVGGNEKEEDEVYRERIRTSGLATVLTGPERQYEEKAKAVSSVIVDAKAVNLTDGTVGVYLILSTETGAAALIESVKDALSPVNVRPLTDTVYVYEATDIPYTLNVEVKSDGSSSVTAAIADAVAEYQEWQDSTIGLAFNPDRLMAAIYQAGATRVTWGEGSCFDTSGAVEYTEIGRTQRCKGIITLTRTT
mgnify:CR=1 FL=1